MAAAAAGGSVIVSASMALRRHGGGGGVLNGVGGVWRISWRQQSIIIFNMKLMAKMSASRAWLSGES
jgi:hypothetical protein